MKKFWKKRIRNISIYPSLWMNPTSFQKNFFSSEWVVNKGRIFKGCQSSLALLISGRISTSFYWENWKMHLDVSIQIRNAGFMSKFVPGGTVHWNEVKVVVLCARQYMPWNLLLIIVLNNFWYFKHQTLTRIC